MRRFIILWVYFLITDLTYCQGFSDQIYDKADGLPLGDINGLVQGYDGKIYMQNSNCYNLSIFDGINFDEVLASKFGLNGTFIFGSMKEGIWLEDCPQSNIRVLLKPDGSFKKYRIEGIRIINDMYPFFRYINFENKIYRYDVDLDNFVFEKKINLPKEVLNSKFKAIYENDNYFTIYRGENKEIYYMIFSKTERLSDKGMFFRRFPVFNPTTIHSKYIFEISKNKVLRKKLDNLKFDKIFDLKVPNGGLCLFEKFITINFNFQIGIVGIDSNKNKHVFIINKDGELIYLSDIPQLPNSNIFFDYQSNLWYPNETELRRRNLAIQFFPYGSDNLILSGSSIAEDNRKRIWVGGYDNSGFCYFENEKWHRPRNKKLIDKRVLHGTHVDGKNNLFFFSENLLGLHYIDKNQNLHKVKGKENQNAGFYISRLNDGRLAAGYGDAGLMIIDPENLTIEKIIDDKKGNHLLNVLTFCQDKMDRIWMARASKGICVYDVKNDTAVTFKLDTKNKKSFGAYASVRDNKGDIWFGGSQGLYVIKKPETLDIYKQDLFQMAEKIKLPQNDSTSIKSMIESFNYIIVNSERALHFIPKVQNNNFNIIYSLWYGKEIQGDGSEQNAMIIDSKGILWAACQKGVLKIDLNKLSFDESLTEIYFNKFMVGNEEISVSDAKISCPTGKRNIDLTWTCSGNRLLSDNVSYNSFIINRSNDTLYQKLYINEGKMNIPYLPPDDYIIKIEAIKNNVISGERIIRIKIPKTLTESWWFWALSVFTILIIPLLYYWSILKEKNVRFKYEDTLLQNKKIIDKSRIESLANFFNPHFINNTLYWIQTKHRKDADTAGIIQSLSENVTMIFNNASHGKIAHSLQNEILLTNNYLKIATTRFGRNIQYHLPEEDEVNTLNYQYAVPILLLQIHAENAIEKGLAKNKDNGMFKVEFEEMDEKLFITCIDNGLGRLNFDAEKLDTRKSSTIVMQELIDILNSYNEDKIRVSYFDNYLKADDIYPHSHGTKIIIEIPKNYTYDIQ